RFHWPISLRAYGGATALAAPLAPSLLKARARRGKEDPARLSERLGRASAARPKGPLVWLHAASVGESVSLLPLLEALKAGRPDLAFLVTSGTRTSAEIMARRLPEGAIHQYAPVDTPGAAARFIDHWRPDAGLFVESELWPNLIAAARRAGTRLALVSARITEKSARGWRAQPGAAGAMLRSFEVVLAQDEATERRIAALGGTVNGRLNLKRVGKPLSCDEAELKRLADAVGARQVILAASTHEGEEALVAEAVAALEPRPLLVLVPRHPNRGAEIVRALAPAAVAVRSAGDPITDKTDVYLADTLGELGLFVRLAKVVVMGGGWAPGVGGHNPLEPARLGVGVVTGPDIANHADAYGEMVQAGAAIVATDVAALKAMLADLLADQGRTDRLDRAARDFAEGQGDQFADALGLVRPLLPPP
ncbi:MAG: 3-deoxy-D-manno-octulosonic acid transferase, partial [Caulobacteraceae bacterium]